MSSKDRPVSSSLTSGVASRRIQPRFGELMLACRKDVMNTLADQLVKLFSQVDDTLFEGAEKAENNKVQALFFDAMRDLRKLRPQLERSYHQRIARNFSDFIEGKLAAEAASEVAPQALELVQNEAFEESLQITNMVSRVRAGSARELFALEQRLALLNNGQKLDEDRNPFGPLALADAFREALQPHALPARIRVILYMLFDRHVMSGLAVLYGRLNQRLIEAGILPNLKFATQRPGDSRPTLPPPGGLQADAAAAGSVTGAAPAAGHAIAAGWAAGAAEGLQGVDPNGPPPVDGVQLLGGLSALLSERRQRGAELPLPDGTRSMASYASPAATSSYSASELLAALNRLQQQAAHSLSQRLQGPQAVEEIKQHLQQQLEGHSGQPGSQRVAEAEGDVIDLVGMLFDFILDDDNLPGGCKSALSHLHAPYLKIALLDKALFTQHQHPARRLLNSMAQAGVLYGDEGGLQAKIHWVVERVINDFSGDLQLLDHLQGEFNEFVATLRHKVELREKRAVEAIKGRDRLLGARQQALEVVQRALAEWQGPGLIRHFLELTWVDVLVFVLLRHGDQSPEWRRAAEAAGQLAWSATPLDDAGRERLSGLRVALLDELRRGLELLGGYHEDGIRRLLQDLVACQHAVQAQQPQLAESLKPTLVESPLGAMLGEDAALLQRSPAESGLSARGQVLLKELERLEFGTWFEFAGADGWLALKLSWFSPTTRNYMFVDHSGQRAAIKPIRQLAREMELGQARILAEERATPLVDRALGAIYRVLQRFGGRTPTRGQGV